MIAPFVTAAEASRLRGDVVFADVRWYLDGRDGRAVYAAGHLPGAIWIDLDAHLAATDLPASAGRHPLPTAEAFALAMTAHGIGERTTVVAYDDSGGMTAGRLAVMLRMLDHDAAVLDGGIAAWDGELETGQREPRAATEPFVRRPWPTGRLADDADAARAGDGHGVLLDARAAERFTGEVALIDKRPGHIPGARNAPWNAVLDARGHVRSAGELRAHYAALGIDRTVDVVASCGSGVSACLNVLALERAGLPPARLYAASWSGWSADPQHPAELGPARER